MIEQLIYAGLILASISLLYINWKILRISQHILKVSVELLKETVVIRHETITIRKMTETITEETILLRKIMAGDLNDMQQQVGKTRQKTSIKEKLSP